MWLCLIANVRQHSVHPTGGSLRVFGHFMWLEVGSVKVALSHPTHQRVTQTVRRLIIKNGTKDKHSHVIRNLQSEYQSTSLTTKLFSTQPMIEWRLPGLHRAITGSCGSLITRLRCVVCSSSTRQLPQHRETTAFGCLQTRSAPSSERSIL